MTRPLTVVAPMAVTDAMLISTDVPETDYAAYAGGTTYGLGARVIVVAEHAVYESVAAANTGHTPATSPDWWARVGPTNRWRLFDGSHSSTTAQATAFSYRLRPGMAVSSLGALNITGATSMRVRLVDPTYGTVYDRTTDLAPLPGGSDWYAWFYGVRAARSLLVLQDLPAFPNADILVDFVGGASLAVGVLLFGQSRGIGAGLKQGARLGITDYSRKETNDFGDVVIVPRAFAKRANFELVLLRAEVDSAIEFLTSLRVTPCLWIGNDYYNSTVIYGYYKEFEVLIAYLNSSDCTLQIEGLT